MQVCQSYVIFTDGGSNENREETGWGAVVLRKTRSHPEVVAELYGRVEMDSSSEYYIGAVSPINETAEATALYQACLWLENDGSNEPAAIISDSERALTMADGLMAPLGSHFREVAVAGNGGINVVISGQVRKAYNRERDRRRGGLELGHVKGHSGCYGNERADDLCELGKGQGPYSQQKTRPPSGESTAIRQYRISGGDGFPHAAVPGPASCVWATTEQYEAKGAGQSNAQPLKNIGKSGKASKSSYSASVMPDYGSGVKMFDKASWRNKVGSRAERDSVKPAAATVRAKINLKTLAASSLFPRSRI